MRGAGGPLRLGEAAPSFNVFIAFSWLASSREGLTGLCPLGELGVVGSVILGEDVADAIDEAVWRGSGLLCVRTWASACACTCVTSLPACACAPLLFDQTCASALPACACALSPGEGVCALALPRCTGSVAKGVALLWSLGFRLGGERARKAES
eukprot:1144234-Pelagomonas_calceolata.AAC.2